jgi:C-terminal processing protease CtpA/Prc
MKKSPAVFIYLSVFCLITAVSSDIALLPALGQETVSNFDRERGRTMLNIIKGDLKKHYYDPTFHGVDVDVRFKEADEKIKRATNLGQVFGSVAQFLIELDDSHTYFLPPGRAYTTDYGWQMQMIGEKCYVVAVKPGSDADKKGLKEGDEIYSVDGFAPLRETMWKINYFYHALRPVPGMRLVVIKPDGREQQLDVLARIKEGKRVTNLTTFGSGADIFDLIRQRENEARLHRHRYLELGEDLFIWKMPAFDLEEHKVDEMVGKFRNRKAVILDLRGNGGGYEITMLRLIGNLFDRDIKIGDLKMRKESKPMSAKTRESFFPGKLIVLIDSKSGSAAELLARVVQLEKRGIVIGDRSAGAVMRSRSYPHEIGVDVVIFFGASITDSDITMTDGKSLERVGVVPDELKLPTASDLAAKRDPILAYALSLAGTAVTPEKAGTMFPLEWQK